MSQRKNTQIRKYFDLNDKENTTFKTFWHTTEAVPTGKLIALNAYIRKNISN